MLGLMKLVAKVLTIGVFIVAAVAQEAGTTDGVPAPTIRVASKMVLVDVVAVDKQGHPISDLERDDFRIEENGRPQTISAFSAQRRSPSMRGGIITPTLSSRYAFSNRPTGDAERGPLVILLLDGLNTDFKDQAYARRELLRYVDSQLQPGQRLAVFALTNQLIRLQDFSSDPNILRAAIARHDPPQLAETAKTRSLNISTTANATFTTGSTDAMVLFQTRTSLGNGAKPSIESALANLQAFDADRAAAGMEARIATTLEAFRSLARSVAAYHGRKNLIWVSSAFPFTLVPDNGSLSPNLDRGADPTAPPPLPNQTDIGVMQQDIQKRYAEEIHRVAAMMGDVQMAISPVDVRGVIPANVNDAGDASLTADGRILFGSDFSHQLSTRGTSVFSSQQNMKDIADQTGGRAFVNRNDIDNAVAIAAEEGRTSFTLAYYPSNKNWNGAFRKIKVRVRRPGVEIRHRTGYFAFDPLARNRVQPSADQTLAATLRRGALPATMVLFDAEVRPATAGMVQITFVVDPTSVAALPGDGGQRIALEFYAVAYDRDGNVAANTGKTVSTALDAEQHQKMMRSGLMLPLDIKLPAGEYRFRLAVQDVLTGTIGSLDATATVR